jgi:mixed-linked glucan synthase
MAAAVTRRVNASLHVELTSANGDLESRRSSVAADSPVAKQISDAMDSDVWMAVEEGDVSRTGNGSRPALFRAMKVKGSIMHPYRSV